jgi:hypothetical protein
MTIDADPRMWDRLSRVFGDETTTQLRQGVLDVQHPNGQQPLTEEQQNAVAEQLAALRLELADEKQKFVDLGRALNDIAETNSWCDTYDSLVQDLGLPGREKDWWVEVEVEVTVEDHSPSSNMDDRLEREYGAPIDTSYIEFRGKVKVRVSGITANSADDAQNFVDEDDVKSEVDDAFSGAEVTLGEWEVCDSGRDD